LRKAVKFELYEFRKGGEVLQNNN